MIIVFSLEQPPSNSSRACSQLLGEFRPHTLLFVPAMLGGAFIALVPGRVKQLQHTAIFQAVSGSLGVNSECFIQSF